MAAPVRTYGRGTARPPHVSAAIDSGTITAAAGELHLVQSAVSRATKRLEDEFGLTLLERTPDGVTPTPAGAYFARHAEAILAGVAAAESDMAAHRDSASGRVRVGFLTSALPPLLAPLRPPARTPPAHPRRVRGGVAARPARAHPRAAPRRGPDRFPLRHGRPPVRRAVHAAGAHRRPDHRPQPTCGSSRPPRPGDVAGFRSGGPSHTWIARAGAAGGFCGASSPSPRPSPSSRRSCRPAPASRCCPRPPCARSRAATRCVRCPARQRARRDAGGRLAGPPAGAAGRRRHRRGRRPRSRGGLDAS